MFVPVWDENPLRSIRFQYVTVGLIVVNTIMLLLEASSMSEQAIASFAIVPSELFQAKVLGGGAAAIPGEVYAVPEQLTLFTYMFFHGDILHLGSNMLFLWVFGDNIEDDLGHFRFLVFYLACGVFAGLTHALMQPASRVPLIGASGAVAGVVAGYIMLHPRVRVWVLALHFIPLRLNALFVLGLWIATQLMMVLIPRTDEVAWWAHIGGIIAGALLVIVLRRPGVPLFDKGLSSA